jgi:hypothetical protein
MRAVEVFFDKCERAVRLMRSAAGPIKQIPALEIGWLAPQHGVSIVDHGDDVGTSALSRIVLGWIAGNYRGTQKSDRQYNGPSKSTIVQSHLWGTSVQDSGLA